MKPEARGAQNPTFRAPRMIKFIVNMTPLNFRQLILVFSATFLSLALARAQDPEPPLDEPGLAGNFADPEELLYPPGSFVPKDVAPVADPQNWRISLSYTNSHALPNSVPQEIKEIVRGLSVDPADKARKIFEHVLNHYDYQPYHGLLKGFEKTFMDRAGNDADLCALLAVMLTEAGYSPEFREGWMRIPMVDIAKWVKADATLPYNDTSNNVAWNNTGRAAMQAIRRGGIYYQNTAQVVSGVVHYTIFRTVLKVQIGGTDYILDPAFKTYRRVPGAYNIAGLRSAMGYDQADFLTTVGGNPVTHGFQGFGGAAVKSALAVSTTSLVQNVLSQHRGKTLTELLGGHELVPAQVTSLPTATPYPFTQVGSSFTTFPAYRKHYMRVKLNAIDKVFATSDIASKRLYIQFDSSHRPHLWADDVEVVSDSAAATATSRLTIAVDHPYNATWDLFDLNTEEAVGNNNVATMKVIAKQFAPIFHDRWFARMREEIAALKAGGAADGDRQVLSRSLDMLGAGYTAQKVGYLNMIQTMTGNGLGAAYLLHDAGIVFHTSRYGVDWLNSMTIQYRGTTGTTDDEFGFRESNMIASSYFNSALEHGLIDQMQRVQGGMSTVRAITRANELNQEIYYVTNTNYYAVKAILASNGWPAAKLSNIETLFNPGASPSSSMVINKNFNVTSGVSGDTWSGGGYWYKPGGAGGGGGFLISGPLHGGESTTEGGWNPFSMLAKIIRGAGQFLWGTVEGIFGFNPRSVEPVDLASGAYLSEHEDLVIGDGVAPRGITFTRYYNSLNNKQNHELGYGWSHNWDVRLEPTSYFPILFGGRLPVDTAAQIVAASIAIDLGNQGEDNGKEIVALMLTANWAVDAQVDNVAAVRNAHRYDLFSRQPDQTFSSPPGSTATLAKTGANYSLTERNGNIWQFAAVNGEQRLSTITDPFNKTLTLTYDSGRIKVVKDCWNRTLTFTYDSGSRLTLIKDSANREVDFTHNSSGDLTTYKDPDSNTSTFVYDNHRITDWLDEQNRLIAKNYYSPLGKVERQRSEGLPEHEWTFYWTGYENIEKDPLGNKKHYLFDALGRHTKFIDAGGRASTVVYDAEGIAIKSTDPLGRYAINGYNSDLNQTTRMVHASDGSVLSTKLFQYDSAKRLWKSTNARGFTTEFLYNPQHKVIKTIHPDAKFEEAHYNSDGTLDWVKSRTASKTTYSSYNNHGNAQIVTSQLGRFFEYRYSDLGDVIKTWDPKLNLTEVVYNGRRMPKQIIDATNKTATIAYDGKGNRTSSSDRLGRTAGATYNSLGKVTTETNAIGKISTTSYNARDLLWKVRSPGGRVTETFYDSSGRVERVESPIGYHESGWDDLTRLTLAENALGEQLVTSYDDIARTTTSTNPRNESVVRKADLNGNPSEITNARSYKTVLSYDSLDRLTGTTTPELKHSGILYEDLTLERREVFTSQSLQPTTRHYNADNQLDQIQDGVGTIGFGYDANGGLKTVTQGGQIVTYGRDSLNRMTSYTDEVGKIIGYGHDLAEAPANRYRTSITYPATPGPVLYDRDKLDRLVKITDWAGRESSFTYYDDHTAGGDGELDEIKRPNNTVRKHYYDTAGRLSRVDELDSGGYLIARFDITLDDAGKINREFAVPQSHSWPADSRTATYNKDDQFLTHSGGTFGYDSEGNMTGAPGRIGGSTVNQGFLFNARNQLYEVPTSGASYTYNAEGHLKSRTIGGVTTSYLVNPAGDLPQILAATTGTQTTRYVYGMGLLYEEKPDGTIRSYHFDYRGNTVALCAGDGLTVTGRAQYTSYGRLVQSSGSFDTPFQFNGRYGVLTDEATGLIHMRARWYSPYLARFINRDPSGFSGGMNFYAFAAGDPVRFVDPSGLGPRSWGRNFGNYVGFPIAGTVVAFTEPGSWVFPKGGSTNLAIYKIFGSLGILTGRDGAQQAANDRGYPFWVNETNNALVDIVQTAWQKVGFLFGFGDSLTNGMGRSLNAAGITGSVTLYGHSQGTMTSVGLIRLGYISGQGSFLNLEGPAISSAAAHATSFFSGAGLSYFQKAGDIIGLANFPNIQNPFLHLMAPIDIFLGAGIHTSYD